MPTQNCGKERLAILSILMVRSHKRPRYNADRNPRGIPTMTSKMMPARASSRVAGNLAQIACSTGVSNSIDVPRLR